MSTWVDRLGGLASAICAVHCLAVAVAPIVLWSDEAFEWGFYAIAVGLALIASIAGYRSHGDLRVLGGFAAGLAALTAGRLGEVIGFHEVGVGLAVIGGAMLIVSHVASFRRTRELHDACCA